MAATDSKASRQRNPAFPAIGLKEAIKRARVLHDSEPRKSMAPETAATHLGYSVKSSGAQQILSALKQFGLLRHDKAGGMRKVRLSDLTHNIILDKREDSEQRLEAIRKAALMPKVYAELWAQAGEDQMLPSDIQLGHYLTVERSPPFYEDAVDGLIKDFRSTIAFAKLEKSDIIEKDEVVHDESDDPAPEAPQGQNETMQPADTTTAIPLAVLEDNGSIRMVSIPRMSEQAFNFMKRMLDTYKVAIVLPKDTGSAKESDN